MKKILVTGAGGYIGCILVRMLLEKNYFVIGLDRFYFGVNKLPYHKNLTLVNHDSRDIPSNMFENVYAVIDLVAISNDPSGELFKKQTYEINHQSRHRTAKLAKINNVARYILPSSCSIYGFLDPSIIADETTKTNPLTNYAKANEMAEQDILPLADKNFSVTVLRQSTVYGYSHRMRFDLAINGMTYGAWESKKIPLMRDGMQWRPMVHITDTARAMIHMLEEKNIDLINGQIFNVGSDVNNYQIKDLAIKVKNIIPDVEIDWYGDIDNRSYRVAFDKIEKIGFKALKTAEDGIKEIFQKLESGCLKKTKNTITLEWYQSLLKKDKNILDYK